MGLFSFFSKKAPKNGRSDKIVLELEELGYFEYTNSEKLNELKNELKSTFESSGVLSTVCDDEKHTPHDSRLYFCDGESLFEIGGIEEYLGFLKHAFDKRGLRLHWKNEISEEKGNHWNHRITVNEKEYVVFEGNMRNNNVWSIAQMNFYELVNDQLKLQGSNERIYPISGGENGEFVFLTDELFSFISKNFYSGNNFRLWEKIYNVSKWIEINQLR